MVLVGLVVAAVQVALPALLRRGAFVAASGRIGQRPTLEGQRPSPVARQFFEGLFQFEPEKPELEDVVIREDYTLAAVFFGLGAVLCAALPYAGLGLGALAIALSLLFFVQTGRVRFCFDKEAFELRTQGVGEEGLRAPGQNIVVGGANRWSYKTFVNYEFFPKGFVEKGLPPILVYFKETQTPKEQWGGSISGSANSEEALAKGAKPGMVHFFPAICDAQQIKAEFERRGCQKITS